MKFQLLTLISIATTTTLAINLEQVRLINDDELIVQDGQFGYPAIINLKDEDAEIAKKTTTTTSSSSSSATTTTTTAKKDKKTTSSASTTISTSTTKSKSKSNSTSTSTSSSSKKHKSETASITKTGGADSVAAVGAVGGPILAALALLL
ncbi:hypothetical GPI-anchored protein, conserved [Candida dubliniensis CD36]|uniref:Hypothetical GPI-anchored protein, conserved n=1 Tax=Candida dubliniensis (strain CD36 / ATCC MYA-646 / CBS 7987 / NCPF 3949 / NRRL Y-17841) TaxID=573826 RepID=B9WFJ8_CANDC|nr:hypothetical GPI-anchored protein, conserved [Candida dubliniensis CD36]CAX42017.1 hypothetical GPI-anchored protein, conserved [Candida dubliniensis CD36]